MTKLTIKAKIFEPDDARNKAPITLLHHILARGSARDIHCVYEEDGRQCDVILLHRWAYPPSCPDKRFVGGGNRINQSALFRHAGYQPLRFFISGEASDFSISRFLRYFFDYSISFNPPSARNLFFSIPLMRDYVYKAHPKQNFKDFFDQKKALYDKPKTRFCNYLFFHDGFDKPNRADFFKILSAYKRIDAPSGSCHNMDIGLKPYGSDNGKQEKLNFISHYKFTIAFENQSLNHMDYVTEKILHPFIAGSVPIYYGCPNVARYFNPAAFINGHDYDSFEDLAARVRQVDQDDRLYQSYLNAHPILESSALYDMLDEAEIFAQRITRKIETIGRLKGFALIIYRLKRMIWGVILRIWYWGVRHWFQYKLSR